MGESIRKRVAGYPDFGCPLRHAHFTSVEGDEGGLSRVARLFGWSCPTAIRFFVIPVVVNAIYCQSWRRFTHVVTEVFKRQPSLANANTAPSVTLVTGVSFAGASCAKAVPDIVERGAASAMPMISFSAPARFRVSSVKISTWNVFGGSALASAFPVQTVSEAFRGNLKNRQSAKLESAKVFRVGVQFVRIGCSHLSLLVRLVVRAVSGLQSRGRLAYCSGGVC